MILEKKDFIENKLDPKYENTIRELLVELGVTTEEVLENTPRRWVNFLVTYTQALRNDFNDFKMFKSSSDQMVIVETKFWSLCEHHLLPFFGKAYIGYIPKDKVIGVSKIVRYVQFTAMKPSIQEELTEEIADKLHEIFGGEGTIVMLKGFHTCVASRYDNGWMTTTALRGVFKDHPSTKDEFLRAVGNNPSEVIY